MGPFLLICNGEGGLKRGLSNKDGFPLEKSKRTWALEILGLAVAFIVEVAGGLKYDLKRFVGTEQMSGTWREHGDTRSSRPT